MEKVDCKKDYFINPEGLKLFRLIFQSSIQPPKAVVFLCHGLFEHCQFAYYNQIIRPFNDIGCMIIAHDHQGHGLSEGKRGFISDFKALVRDVLLDIDEVLIKYKIDKTIPIFLYGHSMGGLISMYAVTERKNFFKGMCLEAPALIFPSKISKITIFCGKIISWIWPTFEMTKVDESEMCRNTDHILSIINDELFIHTGVPAKTGMELLNAINDVQKLFTEVRTPFIIGHGEDDAICEIVGSKILMEQCPIDDKQLISFPKAKHQLRMEIDNVDLEFQSKVVEWLKSKIDNNNNNNIV